MNLFTPASVLSLLVQIKELSDKQIDLSDTVDGQIQLQIDDSVYIIKPEDLTEVSVTDADIENVEDANIDTYEDIADEFGVDVEFDEPVESGLLKEAAKALALGGMIKLSAKLLKG